MKYDLKGVLKYIGVEIWTPTDVTDIINQYRIGITDRDRHSLERAINCVLLQNATRETHKFMGKLESSRMILI